MNALPLDTRYTIEFLKTLKSRHSIQQQQPMVECSVEAAVEADPLQCEFTWIVGRNDPLTAIGCGDGFKVSYFALSYLRKDSPNLFLA